MRKKVAMICWMCLTLLAVGCGTKTTPEIIMPDQPMTSSVSEQKTEDTTKKTDTAKKEDTKDTDSGNSYKVYLITMDLTDSYWQSIDKGCQ